MMMMMMMMMMILYTPWEIWKVSRLVRVSQPNYCHRSVAPTMQAENMLSAKERMRELRPRSVVVTRPASWPVPTSCAWSSWGRWGTQRWLHTVIISVNTGIGITGKPAYLLWRHVARDHGDQSPSAMMITLSSSVSSFCFCFTTGWMENRPHYCSV